MWDSGLVKKTGCIAEAGPINHLARTIVVADDFKITYYLIICYVGAPSQSFTILSLRPDRCTPSLISRETIYKQTKTHLGAKRNQDKEKKDKKQAREKH